MNQSQNAIAASVCYVPEVIGNILSAYIAAMPGLNSLYSEIGYDNYKCLKYEKLISIIVITYNQPDLFKKFISSFLDFFPVNYILELIIIDNSLNNDTEKLINSLSLEKKISFQYYHSPENIGPIKGRNLAVQKASGEVLLFFDDDVEFKASGWLDILINTLLAHPRIGETGAFGVIYPFDEKEDYVQRFFLPGFITPVAWQAGFVMAFKRKCFEDMQGFDEKNFGLISCEDTDASFRVRSKGWIVAATPNALEPDFLIHTIANKNRQNNDQEIKARANAYNAIRNIWGKTYRIINPFKNSMQMKDKKKIN